MLRYLRSRIGTSYEVKNEQFDNLVNFTKLATHGFPQKASAISVDDKLGLIAIGTKDGRILILNTNGTEISASIDGNNFPIESLYFVGGTNTFVVLCDDLRTNTQHFLRCQITSDNCLSFTHFNKEKHLKRITCCEMLNCPDGQSALLIGTVIGNIYALWVQTMELVEYIVFLDSALKDIELESHQHVAINGITTNLEDQTTIYLLINNLTIVFYNIERDEVLKIYKTKQCIMHMSSILYASKLLCSHVDGSYSTIEMSSGIHDDDECKKPYGDRQCTKITKIVSSRSISIGEEFTIFSGGVPCAELDGRETISIFCGDKSLILDFDSPIVDFCLLRENDTAQVLMVLCEEELVAIDLRDPVWRMLPLPWLYPIHSSPITCMSAITGISEQTRSSLNRISDEQRDLSRIFSRNTFPQKNGLLTEQKRMSTAASDLQIVLTGHENGVVNIWMANRLSFQLWVSLNTARDFEGYIDHDQQNASILSADGYENGENGQLPPIRKAGIFDPYSDDHRLAVLKLSFDPLNSEIAVGGRAGQALVYKCSPGTKEISPVETVLMDMTTSAGQNGACTAANSRLRSESAIQARSTLARYPPGFCLINNTIAQFKPAVLVTSIAWDHDSGLLVVGNEFGYAICSLIRKEVLLVKTLISSTDVVQISNMDGPLSRFKSVKKSIRQSFRRKRKPGNETMIPNLRPAEREIVQRNINPNVLGGETPSSLVKVTNFQTFNFPSDVQQRHLLIGTHGSVVFIHSIHPSPANESTKFDQIDHQQIHPSSVQCPLIKEIRLQHQAPIVAIECIRDGLTNLSRLLICTEEQIRSFTVPRLRPTKQKLRFTATEGSRIKKACIVQLKSRPNRQKLPEQFIAFVTNRGEVFLVPAGGSNLKRQYRIQYAEHTDSTAIMSTILSADGQMFYLRPGRSELERCSVSASATNRSNRSLRTIRSEQ